MIISDTAIKKRTTVGVLIVLIIFVGTFSYMTLPREAAPDVNIPMVFVSTVYEGVAPEDIETSVTNKLENKFTGIKGVKEITSVSAEGSSTVTVEFNPGIEIEDALQYVRDKVDLAKGDLPTDAEEPVIKEINIAELPIMMVNISGPISIVRLKEIADKLEDAIEQRVHGVLNVDVIGGREREIRLVKYTGSGGCVWPDDFRVDEAHPRGKCKYLSRWARDTGSEVQRSYPCRDHQAGRSRRLSAGRSQRQADLSHRCS